MNPRDFILKLPKLTAGTEPTSITEKWWPGMNSTIWNDASYPRRYPLEHVRASEREAMMKFVEWYSGMGRSKIDNAYERYLRESSLPQPTTT